MQKQYLEPLIKIVLRVDHDIVTASNERFIDLDDDFWEWKMYGESD